MTAVMTNEGFDKAKRELDELKGRRTEISERIERAKELGDLSENAEYASAREDQSFTEGRIQELEALLKNSVIVSSRKNTTKVGVGSTVVVESPQGQRTFTIVGYNEADPVNGKISNESPLGRAFLGQTLDTEVTVQTPRGMIAYKIKEIR